MNGINKSIYELENKYERILIVKEENDATITEKSKKGSNGSYFAFLDAIKR